ncbi:SDR family oxidoreductase [Pseudonocardia ailaonensis]|uniref:SDR family oxidoreductase n=1 Tax=Pseudonocardia ailaonensis TaxID=367279 RepID=A0ABN2N8B3_9PSEU
MSEPVRMVPQTLAGQVAVVTGAGQGIGRAEALALAERGAKVVVNDLLEDRAAQVVDEIGQAGGEAVANTSSVTSAEGGAELTRLALERFGGLHVVVNNAGFLRPGPFGELGADQIDAVLDVHLRAAFHVTQPAWRVMKEQRYGRVVMTGSSAGMFSQAANSNYCAAKAGVFGLARALATEGEDHGIAVNVVLPFAATTISVENPIPGNQEARERRGAAYRGEILRRRDPALVAPLVAHLASPACRDNGDVYSVCGGRYARVFVALGPGWIAPEPTGITAEDLEANWAAVRSTTTVSEPRTLFDEVAEVVTALDGLVPTAARLGS